MMKEPMDCIFSVFNLHVNNAGKRANKDCIEKFGREAFMKIFPRLYRDGMMSIFHSAPTEMTQYWVDCVTKYVNEDRQAVTEAT